jgi:pimeloyl-ACP methyl ester carboxylesterase
LDITFNEESGQLPTIIYAHGFNGFKDWGNFDLITKQFVNAGFSFVKFNFSHNGTTSEHQQDFTDLDAFAENNYTKELFDLNAIIDWVSDPDNPFSKYLDITNIGLIGHSMGGGISIIKAVEDPRVKALATWASISQCKTPWGGWTESKMAAWKETGVQYYLNGRTKQQMPMYYQLYLDYENNAARLNILQAATKLSVPFLICHGQQDTSVGIDSAYALHQSNSDSELFIVDSDHVFGRKHPWTESTLPLAMQEVIDKNIAFFSKHLIY